MNVQNEEKVEDSLELLMRGEEEEIVKTHLTRYKNKKTMKKKLE